VDIDELRALFGLSRQSIWAYSSQGLIPPPSCRGRYARYGSEHVEAIRAYRALLHTNTRMTEVAALLREDGISLVEYKERREDAIRTHGLGVA
jgi:DNA-binding transcriptional MerR regulator